MGKSKAFVHAAPPYFVHFKPETVFESKRLRENMFYANMATRAAGFEHLTDLKVKAYLHPVSFVF